MVRTVNLTIWKQVELMRQRWPDFRELNRTGRLVRWEGRLRPLSQMYTVQIAFYRERKKGSVERPLVPYVTVVDPPLRRRTEKPKEPIPHHYQNRNCPERPFLCLYDPAAREWYPRKSIAHTIVPWTIDWLACYEGWLATGEWMGGGRHPTSE